MCLIASVYKKICGPRGEPACPMFVRGGSHGGNLLNMCCAHPEREGKNPCFNAIHLISHPNVRHGGYGWWQEQEAAVRYVWSCV